MAPYAKHLERKAFARYLRVPYVADLGLKITPFHILEPNDPTSNSRGTTWLPEFSSKPVQPTSVIRYRRGAGSSPDMLGSNSHEFEHDGFFFPLRMFGVYYLNHTTGRSGAVASESWYACLGGLTLNST